ncbi:hypothetical protein BYT27DRAFT_7204059 [Phlegmacium glaucopus]|nr:hypothetical protein BYT27DRAFT_7204059 [Phlegmacium glaucopus]
MLSRLSAVRRLPRTFAVRYYTDGRTEGSVAQSKGFSKKEKAHEDQYIKQHEQQQLQKLKAQIDAKKAELNSLEQELEKNTKK